MITAILAVLGGQLHTPQFKVKEWMLTTSIKLNWRFEVVSSPLSKYCIINCLNGYDRYQPTHLRFNDKLIDYS